MNRGLTMVRTKFFNIVLSVIIFTLVIFITGCGGGGGSSPSVSPEELTTVNVTGKIIGSDNNPIAGATVTFTSDSDPLVVTTDQWGEFSAKVAPGDHAITITNGNETLYRSTFTAKQGSHIALGTITPNYPDSSGDTQAPTVPGEVNGTTASSTQINLNWSPSTDNAVVTAYRIYRNGTQLPNTVTGTTYLDTGLSASTQYCYTISAGDAKGNWSAKSDQVCITTSSPMSLAINFTAPAYYMKDVDPYTTIQVTFNSTINQSTVTTSTFAVTEGSGISVPGTLSFSGPIVTFTPSNSPLEYGTTYKVILKSGTSGIKDISGNTLASDYSWSFTTMFSGGIPELLKQFINAPTQPNYNVLMSAIAAAGATKEAYLYKAVGELLDIFNSAKGKQMLSDFGLPDIGFDTDFEQLRQLDLNTMAYTYLMHSPNLYLPETKALLLETENRLTQVDSLLAQTDGIDLSLSFGPLDTVRFDSTDIKVLRAMTNLLKAYFVYLQTLDYTITNYTVTYNTQTYDLRYLLTHNAVHVTDGETDRTMMQQVWMQVLNNNTSLLTYLDRSATSKLAEFRTTLLNAFGFYESAVTDIENMTQQQRRDRYDNAFNLDSDYEVAFAKVIWDQAINSFVGCMNNTSTQFIIPRSVQTNEIMIAGGDGFYYPEDIYDIYLDMYQPNSSGSQITIYNLLALGTGKTPRDIIYEVAALPANVAYNPYVLYVNSTPTLTNLADIIWEDFYTIK
jgi:hypothetical protein